MQRIDFNLQSALDGAKLVTRELLEVIGFKATKDRDYIAAGYPYESHVDGELYHFTSKGTFFTYGEHVLDLFLSIPYTDIIGNAITEPMLSAEEWYAMMGDLTTDKGKEWLNSALNSGFMYVVQQYGNYVADYLTKNK